MGSWLLLVLLCAPQPAPAAPRPVRMAFMGLHGGVFEILQRHAAGLDVEVAYVTDAEVAQGSASLAAFDLAFVEHVRGDAADRYRDLFRRGMQDNPRLQAFGMGGAERRLPDLVQDGVLRIDEAMDPYWANTDENLRRFLVYVLAAHCGRDLDIEPPAEVEREGLYHPDHAGLFPDARAFLGFARQRFPDADQRPRAMVAVHLSHLLLQQPRVVDALIREFEAQGVLAVAVLDQTPAYETLVLEFKPQVVVHTCHSRDAVAFRERAGVPHLHSVFFRQQAIDAWQTSPIGLASNELNLHVVSQELIGGIEPMVGAGTPQGGGGSESFTPIPERIRHIVARARGWIDLARTPAADKKVAVLYWDREMGKAELMRGSATGMHLNAPRSLVNVLLRMRETGYRVDPLPRDEDELIGWMQDHGRQIGVWADGVLDRLATSGLAVLVPAATYRAWFEARVPAALRRDVIARWGEPPGRFLTWKDAAGAEFVVIPRIDLGHVVLLPQPLRGEAHDTSLVHDRAVPPPHNYLCTYFWLAEEFGADALVHFGTHGSELALPGKDHGLSANDWTDILMGSMPNLYPWIQNNLGESVAARRRTYAVLIAHLVPPSITAGLSDGLENLHQDVDKWSGLEEGALKERFAAQITRQCREQHLDRDLHLDLSGDRLLSAAEIDELREYLHALHEETTPVSLHVMGEPPAEALRGPWIVRCLRRPFLDALAAALTPPQGPEWGDGDREAWVRAQAEHAVRLVTQEGMTPTEALAALHARLPAEGPPAVLVDGLELARRIEQGLLAAGDEIEQLLAALDGRFVPPAPAGSPDRNPAAVPTGRNMYVMNPEEVPTRPSWEIGVRLAEQLLAGHRERTGRLPPRVAFTLSPSETFQDYGVQEAQVLYLLGVRPVWDAQNLVTEVERIPAAELGRPRVDVFLAASGYYRDMLPTRMRLLDEAVRLVADLDEDGNPVHAHTAAAQEALLREGLAPERAAALARARIFGPPPGEIGSAGYYYLVERSGEWNTREELAAIYLEHSSHAYTDGAWGEDALPAYRQQVQGAEVVVRSWSDRTRSPLSNKYFWFRGGSQSLAIEHVTGKEPEFFLADVRDPDAARMVDAEDALRQDFRVRLFNRRWIEGMMKEGYAGADQVAVHVGNAMGWRIMRRDSVADDLWQEIVDVYLRDSKDLNVREWFEAENPFALQEVAEVLLEVARKGYWSPDAATLHEIAAVYADSVARHGESGGLRGGGNAALERFVEEALRAPGTHESDALIAAMQARRERDAAPSAPPDPATTAQAQPPQKTDPAPAAHADPAASREPVAGVRLEPTGPDRRDLAPWWIGAGVVLLLGLGAWRRSGAAA